VLTFVRNPARTQPEKRTNTKKGGSDGSQETGQEEDHGQKDDKEDGKEVRLLPVSLS
jgi:hypothetical protein